MLGAASFVLGCGITALLLAVGSGVDTGRDLLGAAGLVFFNAHLVETGVTTHATPSGEPLDEPGYWVTNQLISEPWYPGVLPEALFFVVPAALLLAPGKL